MIPIKAALAARDRLLELSEELDQTVRVSAHLELGNPDEQIFRIGAPVCPEDNQSAIPGFG